MQSTKSKELQLAITIGNQKTSTIAVALVSSALFVACGGEAYLDEDATWEASEQEAALESIVSPLTEAGECDRDARREGYRPAKKICKSWKGKKSMLRLINNDRSAEGRAELKFSKDLQLEAQRWAEFMAKNDHYEHRTQLGKNLDPDWTELGENIAWHYDVEKAHTSLMNSPSHKANILYKNYESIGIGIHKKDGYFWICQIFKSTTSSH